MARCRLEMKETRRVDQATHAVQSSLLGSLPRRRSRLRESIERASHLGVVVRIVRIGRDRVRLSLDVQGGDGREGDWGWGEQSQEVGSARWKGPVGDESSEEEDIRGRTPCAWSIALER